jgi:hypothetical protein
MLPAFQPQWDARKGARELYETFCTTNLTVDDFEGERYKRIAHIQKLLANKELDPTLRWTEQRGSATSEAA